jgi:CubicO group peptidase (beta-lactamase class C family)
VDAQLRALAPLGLTGRVVIVRSGTTVLDASYGWADRARKVPVTRSTAFDIASIGKVFTAIAIYRLQDEGKLAVGDPITRFLPNVPADKRAITLRQLLTHRSGLPLYHDEGADALTKEEALDRILHAALRFPPGTRYAYSNAGYTLLAAIVEAASGERFQPYVRSRVLRPAGMTATGWIGEQIWSERDRAHGYAKGRDRGPFGGKRDVSWTLLGAGGIVSSPSELAKLAAALHDRRLLSPTALADMFRSEDPRPTPASGDSAAGWNVWSSPRQTAVAEKQGYAGGHGFSSVLRIEPREGNVIALTLSSDWNETYPIGIHAIIAQLIERTMASSDRATPQNLARDDVRDGTFTLGTSTLTIEDDVVTAEGQPLIDVLLGSSETEARACAEANQRAAALLQGRADAELQDILRGAREVRIVGSTPEWVIDSGGVVTFLHYLRNGEERTLRLHWRGASLYCIGGSALPAPYVGEIVRGGILHVGLMRLAAMQPAEGGLVLRNGARYATTRRK